MKNKDRGNRNAQGWVYVVGNAEKRGNAPGNPDANIVTGTFLLNNHYASILFDTGADRSFISTAFSSLINIAPTPLKNCYDVELVDEKLVGIDTIIRGCTLNFLDHPFNIDLMPVELGSFDVIIDKRLKPLEFEVGNMVLLKVSPWKGTKCLAEGDVVVSMDEIQLDDKLHMIESQWKLLIERLSDLSRVGYLLLTVRLESNRGQNLLGNGEDQIKMKYS
ncbi:putative reverse transcriptase domain-containing protein [Tanacetum coccineum]